MRIQAPPEWGIEPVDRQHRILGALDLFVLWSSLGVGLLVLEAGALLVPGLGLAQALGATLIGTLAGSLLLALTGVAGADRAAPTMVLLRPVLGRRGSHIASLLNLVQLIGWTGFELWVIALAADRVSSRWFGFSAYGFWLAVFALWSVLLALGGPLVVVRQWLEKFGLWLVFAASAWMTYSLLSRHSLAALLQRADTGGLSFPLAVDLVIAMPISWLPLVADYNRFARKPRSAFWGTYLGYALANLWFYGLGALFILTADASEPTPEALTGAIAAMTGGGIALLVILVDETDNAFADIYSAAVTIQNMIPRASQRMLVLLVGGVGVALAAFLTMSRYFDFLLLIGSIFVPLFGVFAADYFVLRRRRLYLHELYGPRTGRRRASTLNWVALVAWAAGAAVYHALARAVPWLGASLPGFAASFVLYLGLVLGLGRRSAARPCADWPLYVIADPQAAGGRPLAEIVRAALRGGAAAVQLRDKRSTTTRMIELGRELRAATREAGVPLIVNDRVDVALAVDADGVHLGPDDLPPRLARRLLGRHRFVGVSAGTVEEALQAERDGADYIGVGDIYGTASKPDAGAPIGPEALARIAGSVRIPTLAVGGITAERAPEVIGAGATGVAVLSAIVGAEDPEAAARSLCEAVEGARSRP